MPRICQCPNCARPATAEDMEEALWPASLPKGRATSSQIFFQNRHDFGLRRAAGDVNLFLFVYEDVDLAADAEFREIDARFDRETSTGQDAAIFAGLQIVHVGAVAMDFLAAG